MNTTSSIHTLLRFTITLLQGPKYPVLPTLTYTALSLNVLVIKRLGYIYFTLYKLINIILNEIKDLICGKEKSVRTSGELIFNYFYYSNFDFRDLRLSMK